MPSNAASQSVSSNSYSANQVTPKPVSPNVRRAISSYKQTAMKPSVPAQFFLHKARLSFDKMWVFFSPMVVHLAQPASYNLVNAPTIQRQQKEALAVSITSLALPVFLVVMSKRFLRARSPLLSLTQRGGTLSTIFFGLWVFQLLRPVYYDAMIHKLNQNTEAFYRELHVNKHEAAVKYQEWLDRPWTART